MENLTEREIPNTTALNFLSFPRKRESILKFICIEANGYLLSQVCQQEWKLLLFRRLRRRCPGDCRKDAFLFLDPGGFAAQLSQEIKLGPADLALLGELDLVDHG